MTTLPKGNIQFVSQTPFIDHPPSHPTQERVPSVGTGRRSPTGSPGWRKFGSRFPRVPPFQYKDTGENDVPGVFLFGDWPLRGRIGGQPTRPKDLPIGHPRTPD